MAEELCQINKTLDVDDGDMDVAESDNIEVGWQQHTQNKPFQHAFQEHFCLFYAGHLGDT
jgi:hypothetical protein